MSARKHHSNEICSRKMVIYVVDENWYVYGYVLYCYGYLLNADLRCDWRCGPCQSQKQYFGMPFMCEFHTGTKRQLFKRWLLGMSRKWSVVWAGDCDPIYDFVSVTMCMCLCMIYSPHPPRLSHRIVWNTRHSVAMPWNGSTFCNGTQQNSYAAQQAAAQPPYEYVADQIKINWGCVLVWRSANININNLFFGVRFAPLHEPRFRYIATVRTHAAIAKITAATWWRSNLEEFDFENFHTKRSSTREQPLESLQMANSIEAHSFWLHSPWLKCPSMRWLCTPLRQKRRQTKTPERRIQTHAH